MQPRTLVRKAAEDYSTDRRRRGQHPDDRRDRDPCRTIGGEPIDAGGNGGKSNRSKAMGPAQFDRAAIARCQHFIFALASAMPHRADGMNHVPCKQPMSFGDFGIAGGAALKLATFGQKLRSCPAVDCTIHAAAAEQRCIRGVDDGVNAQARDVGDDDFEPRRADPARGQAQAEAAAATVTPLSAKSCCSSPAWNISRMMSQPPTNSPLT